MSGVGEHEAAAVTAEALSVLRSGRPGAGAEGAARLRQAVSLGSGEAAATLAYFAAAGLGQSADWDRSLDLLQQAAELGWAPAMSELRVLARRMDGDASVLRAAIDIGTCVAAREMRIVCEGPRIGAIDRFFSAEECAWLIDTALNRLAPAAVYARDRQRGEVMSARTNSTADFGILDMDVVFTVLRHRIANTTGFPPAHFEQPAVLHYAPGQQFKPHYDFLDARFEGPAAELRARGQRLATFLVYLNQDFEGGETEFPLIDYRFKGKTGDAIVFANVDPNLAPELKSKHAGRAPTRGEKWLLSQWVRDRAQI